MANVSAVGYRISTDGGTLTPIDQSTYSDDPIGNYTRKVQLWTGIDGTGTMLAELDFVGDNLEVDYAWTADRYVSLKLIHTGSPAMAVAYDNVTPMQYEQNALNMLLKGDCGCKSTKPCGKASLGFIYMYQSQVATLAGNSGLANSFITSAYKVLTS